jgi:large subunit ribosomal protein L13
VFGYPYAVSKSGEAREPREVCSSHATALAIPFARPRRDPVSRGDSLMGAQAHRATQSTRPQDVQPRWYVIDAADQVLGRLSTRVASIIRGKHRPIFTPHVDTGDFVIVVNAEKVKLTGRKREKKLYQRHTGYTGHVKTINADDLLNSAHADRVVRHAVRGMLPKNNLGRKMFKKLKVYTGPDHPHAAQKPEELKLG